MKLEYMKIETNKGAEVEWLHKTLNSKKHKAWSLVSCIYENLHSQFSFYTVVMFLKHSVYTEMV